MRQEKMRQDKRINQGNHGDRPRRDDTTGDESKQDQRNEPALRHLCTCATLTCRNARAVPGSGKPPPCLGGRCPPLAPFSPGGTTAYHHPGPCWCGARDRQPQNDGDQSSPHGSFRAYASKPCHGMSHGGKSFNSGHLPMCIIYKAPRVRDVALSRQNEPSPPGCSRSRACIPHGLPRRACTDVALRHLHTLRQQELPE